MEGLLDRGHGLVDWWGTGCGRGVSNPAPHTPFFDGMPIDPSQRRRWIVTLIALVACRGGESGPSTKPPARLDAVSPLSRSGVVATTLAAPLTVKVVDVDGRVVAGATVTFAVTQGNGAVSPRVSVSDNKGQASTTWTLGTVSGANEVSVAVSGIATGIKFTASATAGAAAVITMTPRTARIVNGVDTTRINATARDSYGNQTDPAPTFTVRDPTLVSVTATGLVRALRRGGSTYILATSGARTDSVLLTVLAPGESICTAVATPRALSVSQVVSDVGSDICVRAGSTTEEFALIAYYNSAVPSATTQIETRANGVTAVSSSQPSLLPAFASASTFPQRDEPFERALRSREASLLQTAAPAARSWYSSRRMAPAGRASYSLSTVSAVPAEGELMALNVNVLDGCGKADLRTGRVVAVTNKAIIVADTANPAGGFTDTEYRSFGVTFDTLIDPVNTAAFGAPADFDETGGRSVMFFTRAINALTPRGSGSVVLGLFFGRDILPKSSCASSNFAKMFYLLVPDSAGVASDARSKGLVTTITNGTIAHEYQHLINSTRRMYVNNAVGTTEEHWLNEGLSHIAEELNYFAAAKLQPRSNLDAAALAPSIANGTFQTYLAQNFSRYRRYLQTTETQSPTGSDPFDDDLPTRGGAWSFLRYVADHQASTTGDGTLWFRLANASTTGLANLSAALGTATAPLLRDWATSVYIDDTGTGVDPRYQQPSWNFRSAMPAGGFSFALFTRTLSDGTSIPVTLTGGGTAFKRFAVAAGQDALLSVTSVGQPIPPTMQLSLVRIR